jgi:AraC-like DNA-binding protein
MKTSQTLYIDNMVCARCKLAVRHIAGELGWRVERVELGLLSGWPPKGEDAMEKIAGRLEAIGFRLRDGAGGPVSRIKGVIIDYVYDDKANDRIPLSERICHGVGLSYSHLSRLFTREEGRTIGDFYRLHRMERGKKLLAQTDEQVSTIAYRLHYGSLARFTSAFKRATGHSPTEYRERGDYQPKPLDKL